MFYTFQNINGKTNISPLGSYRLR